MKTLLIKRLSALVLMLVVLSCTKMRSTGILSRDDFSDTTAALKDITDVIMGVAIDYSPTINDARYAGVIKRDFDRVTFGYQMKHGAIVLDNGTMDFSKADALVNAVGSMQVHGHTLGWHANQNATYLKQYAGIVSTAVELIKDPGFESGDASSFNYWFTYNAQSSSTVTVTTVANEIHAGSRAMKVVAKVGDASGQWKVQVASDTFTTVSGKQYNVTYYVKAASGTGSIRLSTQNTDGSPAQYQADQNISSSAWNLISWTFTANSPKTRILFDMGAQVNTYYIDDASVKELVPVVSPGQIAAKLDTALNTFITAEVTRYKAKVHSWDVVNELLADNGTLRDNTNTTAGNDVLVWSNYLGRDYALKAFTYAQAADPTALLFINDYDLEARPVKLDSLIAMVKELKSKGAKIDGIGTQMHISWNTSYDAIDQMMKKLAATGLKIHVSELDVKINPTSRSGFVLTPLEANYQALMYQYVVQSYLKYIPQAQQFGITIWGVTDNTSWLYKSGLDYPLLYNADYSKKQAYSGVLGALQGK